jgi:hypothetical protein
MGQKPRFGLELSTEKEMGSSGRGVKCARPPSFRRKPEPILILAAQGKMDSGLRRNDDKKASPE